MLNVCVPTVIKHEQGEHIRTGLSKKKNNLKKIKKSENEKKIIANEMRGRTQLNNNNESFE